MSLNFFESKLGKKFPQSPQAYTPVTVTAGGGSAPVMATDSTDYSQSISYSTSTAASRDAGGHGSIEENKSQLCVNTVSIVELIVDKQCELLCVFVCV